jgi:hypothetical protein
MVSLPTALKRGSQSISEIAYQRRRPTTGTLAMTADRCQVPNGIRLLVNDIRTSKAIRTRAAPWCWVWHLGRMSQGFVGVSFPSTKGIVVTRPPNFGLQLSHAALPKVSTRVLRALLVWVSTVLRSSCQGQDRLRVSKFPSPSKFLILSPFFCNIEQRKKQYKRSYKSVPTRLPFVGYP